MPLRVFPVATPPGAHYADDFAAPRQRPDGTTASHQGNDLFAPDGTPVLAPDDGSVRFTVDPIGGPSFYLKADDGTTYYGTHLSGYEGQARRVAAGEVIAYVGHGGNAATTPSHLHFEVHPAGGPAVDPFPYLGAAARLSAPSGTAGAPETAQKAAILLGLGLVVGALYLHDKPTAGRHIARLLSRYA